VLIARSVPAGFALASGPADRRRRHIRMRRRHRLDTPLGRLAKIGGPLRDWTLALILHRISRRFYVYQLFARTTRIKSQGIFRPTGWMQGARAALLLIAAVFCAGHLSAQGTAGASSTMSSTGLSAEPDKASSSSGTPSRSQDGSGSAFAAPVRPKKGTSGPLIAPSGPAADKVNRKKFEENAGKDAGKVLLRSVPNGASIFLNHMLVGDTPLLLFLAPGRYDVEMRGPRQQSGHRVLTVTAKQTQAIVIDLSERYPPSVSLHW